MAGDVTLTEGADVYATPANADILTLMALGGADVITVQGAILRLDAIDLGLGDDWLTIDTTNLAPGAAATMIFGSYENDSVFLRGGRVGTIDLWIGQDYLLAEAGITTTAGILMGDGNDALAVTGGATLIGNFDGGAGDNFLIVTNGVLIGAVYMGPTRENGDRVTIGSADFYGLAGVVGTIDMGPTFIRDYLTIQHGAVVEGDVLAVGDAIRWGGVEITMTSGAVVTGAITTGGRDDDLLMSGAQTGAIDLGGNADRLLALSGANAVGAVTMGDGDDTITVSVGATLTASGGFSLGAGNDTFLGGPSGDVVHGGDGADGINGGDGADALYADGGADLVQGGVGADYVSAGADDGANDAFYSDYFDGVFYVPDADAGDAISYSDASGPVTIDLGAAIAWGASIGLDRLFGFSQAYGSVFGDVLIGVNTGVAPDVLRGLEGNDYLYLLDGDDAGYGGAGIDVMIGAAGNDVLNGEADQDYLYGSDGADTLNGDGGVDVLLGGAGNDQMNGGAEGDYLYGENGDDIGIGGAGNDIFVMAAGNDIANGDDGQDYFYMGEGDDAMNGGAGVDVMLGEAGNDTFNGGLGVDYAFLGPTGAGDNDRVIMDKNASGVIVLNGFEAGGMNDSVRLSGTGWTSFSQVQAAISDFSASGGFCILTLDTDTSVWLIGVTPGQLTAADFVFA